MRKHITFFICLSLLCYHMYGQSGIREKYNFNSDWRVWIGDDSLASQVVYNDEAWKKVTIPYAWNEDAAFKLPIDQLPTGIAWYRKHFSLPAGYNGRKVFLEFEGVRQAGEFFINSKWVGRHENGAMAFGFDITSVVTHGDNVIAVRIDNSWTYREKSSNSPFQWSDKNFNANYGGITKNAYLHIVNPLYQTLPLYANLNTIGVYVYASNINVNAGVATITAQAEIKNELAVAQSFQFKVALQDAITGKFIPATFPIKKMLLQPGEVQKVSSQAVVKGLQFWSWGYGYLYNVHTSVVVDGAVVDEVTTTTGFRKTEFKSGMLLLNEKPIQIKGYAQRSSNEWPAVGNAVPAWLSDYSNNLIVESNGNLVRWMHITPWKQDIESCDRVGLMQAMPAGDAEKDVEGRRWEQRKELMRDAIIYNRNNPSIIFYECGNNQISEAHMKEMKAIRNKYDSLGGRAIGSRNMLDSKEAEYGGEMLYINKSAGKPMWQMEYSRDEGLRKYWDEYSPPFHKEGDGPLYKGQDASSYNHNQDTHAIENIIRWYEYWEQRPGTGKRVNGGGVNIIFSESNTHYRGAENYRRSGEVDAMRIPKDGYYAHQVMWDGWVDNQKPLTHIIGHWNYKEGVVKNIYVVSNTSKVELFINGKSVGYGEQSNRFLFTYKNIPWQPGTITAIAYNEKGAQVSKASHSTAGEPASIRMYSIGKHNLLANGSDLALVEFEVVDKAGNRCPTALQDAQFELQGEGQWRGGIAQGPDNYILSQTLPVECGVNRFFIRSTTTAGKILILAKAKGLQQAQLTLESQPVKVVQGLSLIMPQQGLKGNLSKGKTPTAMTFALTRKPLIITKAYAAINEDKVIQTFDDNEATDWVNDGKLNTAWVEYELAEKSPINQAVMKLNNFRTRTYPIRIRVDGQVVYEGITSKTLGYFTVSFKTIIGKKIRIELINDVHTFQDNTKEVNNQKLGDGVERTGLDAKGTFSIIEMELYGPIK